MKTKATIAKMVKGKDVSSKGKQVGVVPPGVTAKQDLVNRNTKKTKMLKSAFVK